MVDIEDSELKSLQIFWHYVGKEQFQIVFSQVGVTGLIDKFTLRSPDAET